jgi:predicted Ser/Thr protein kinase
MDDEIARGGMGAVYRAFDQRLQREVAIKVLLKGAQATPAQRQRFRREALALARLTHPHIVTVYDVGEHDGKPFMVMDFVKGRSLEQLLEQEGALSGVRAARLLHQLAGALHHAHQAGILHRDLKPANVMLDDDGQPQLTDFGIAHAFAKPLGEGGTLTQVGAFVGTPGYWAPEQAGAKKDQQGPATDVYGLGAILYSALTLQAPHQGTSLIELMAQVMDGHVEPPSTLVADVDPDLEAICMRCLEREPADRYASAEALATALQDYLLARSGTGRHGAVAGPRPGALVLDEAAPVAPAWQRGLTAALAGLALVALGWAALVGARESQLEGVALALRARIDVLEQRRLLAEDALERERASLQRDQERGQQLRKRRNELAARLQAKAASEPEPGGSPRPRETPTPDAEPEPGPSPLPEPSLPPEPRDAQPSPPPAEGPPLAVDPSHAETPEEPAPAEAAPAETPVAQPVREPEPALTHRLRVKGRMSARQDMGASVRTGAWLDERYLLFPDDRALALVRAPRLKLAARLEGEQLATLRELQQVVCNPVGRRFAVRFRSGVWWLGHAQRSSVRLDFQLPDSWERVRWLRLAPTSGSTQPLVCSLSGDDVSTVRLSGRGQATEASRLPESCDARLYGQSADGRWLVFEARGQIDGVCLVEWTGRGYELVRTLSTFATVTKATVSGSGACAAYELATPPRLYLFADGDASGKVTLSRELQGLASLGESVIALDRQEVTLRAFDDGRVLGRITREHPLVDAVLVPSPAGDAFLLSEYDIAAKTVYHQLVEVSER